MNSSEDHSVRCKGSVDILVPEGYSGGYGESVLSPDSETGKLQLSYIRGRGNSTWGFAKKPYKIKFESAQDLFGMGSSKEWALMANALDNTMMKNRIISWLGEQLGMPFTPRMVPVDVVLKGSYGSEAYLGTYCLSETVNVEESRVNIKKLKKNDKDKTGDNNISGGYLISLYNDSQDGDEPRNAVFKTDGGIEYYLREPEYEGDNSSDLTEGQIDQRDYISDYIQNVENHIMQPETIDEAAHDEIAELLDLTSAADYWLFQEFTKNGDAFITGSTYLFKDRDGKLCFGPLWDFDGSLGAQDDDSTSVEEYEEDITGFNNTWFDWFAALREKDPKFDELLVERWNLMNEKLIELTKPDGIIDQYKEEVAASQVKNGLLWPDMVSVSENAEQYNLAVEKQKKWINQRREWFNDNIGTINKATLKITYLLDGEIVGTENIQYNSAILNPPDIPEQEGRIFMGWYCEKEKQYAGDFSVLEDTVFIAKMINEADAINPSAIYLPRTELWANLQDGTLYWMTDVSYVPDNVTVRNVTWSSSKESVATVYEGGFVTLNGVGDAVITATHQSGVSASYTLHVYDSEQTEVHRVTGVRTQSDMITLSKGKAAQIKWTIQPAGCAIPDTMITYETSNGSVVSVDDLGVVTAKKAGTAVITVVVTPIYPDETEETCFKAKCTVTVTDPDAAPAKTKIKPKKTGIKSLRRTARAVTVKWKKQSAKVASSHITGYQVQIATNKKFTKNRRTFTVKGYKKTAKKITKLKKGRKYYIRVRTYKVVKGKKYYSSWSKIRVTKKIAYKRY